LSEQNLTKSLFPKITDNKSRCLGNQYFNTFLEKFALAVVSAIVVGIVPATTAISGEVGFLSGQGSR
jgi:hypothetical protein